MQTTFKENRWEVAAVLSKKWKNGMSDQGGRDRGGASLLRYPGATSPYKLMREVDPKHKAYTGGGGWFAVVKSTKYGKEKHKIGGWKKGRQKNGAANSNRVERRGILSQNNWVKEAFIDIDQRGKKL